MAWKSIPMLGIVLLAASALAQEIPFSMQCFRPDRRQSHAAYEKALNEACNPASLRTFHEYLASEPHLSGTEGDRRVINYIAAEFAKAGLEVETHWIWPYLSSPIAAELEIIAPERIALEVTEPPIDADSDTAHPNLTIGFNAYSGSGDATAEVVYANYGRKEDFEKLKSLGVDCTGKVVVARYGGNFRGYKAKFAEQAGAAALIIYTDPADSGYMRGLMYPEGGWATEHQIQRGSLQTMPYSGDPLTPNIEATESAPRLDPREVDLPNIPVQPVGWAAAQKILERMTGRPVPEEAWQGALPFSYRLEGGPDLRVRVMVKQERRLTKTANIIGTLRGSKYPDELIIVGCHHDAWCFGAADPLAGTHVLLESARLFGEAAKRGERPERTVIFAAWAAEEHGIVGSSEWVEANIDRLMKGGVAYFNLDMAAMGPLFGASGSPTLATLIVDATRDVPQPREPARTVFEEWTTRKRAIDRNPSTPQSLLDDPTRLVGSMGGGSDHVGFYFHACIPSASVGGGGSRGTSYHSNYDTLCWYRKVVGEDYEPSLMVTRVLNIAVARLARADILPIDPTGIAPAVAKHLEELEQRAITSGMDPDIIKTPLTPAPALTSGRRPAVERLDPHELDRLNEHLRLLERTWFAESGQPDRPWMRSTFMAPDRDSGYSAWPLPRLRQAVEDHDAHALADAVADIRARLDSVGRTMDAIIASGEPSAESR
ncbi:MAG: M28 family peptidase [Phycisphaerae bacterium]|nr:M28 family peptidase [Phycisphaerae bacterium]